MSTRLHTKQPYRRIMLTLLGGAALGLAMWFFGNLYEQIVIVPNIGIGGEGLSHYRAFFATTNPIYYFVPLPWIGLFAVFTALWLERRQPTELRRVLVRAGIWGGIVGILTIIIITQSNVKLFFDPITRNNAIHVIQVIGTLLGVIRVLCEAIALYYTTRGWTLALLTIPHTSVTDPQQAPLVKR